jgi:hypothetical protein
MSNLSVLLRACDRMPELAAEAFAYEVRTLVRGLSSMLPAAARAHGLNEVPAGLLTFILNRHWHLRFPGN